MIAQDLGRDGSIRMLYAWLVLNRVSRQTVAGSAFRARTRGTYRGTINAPAMAPDAATSVANGTTPGRNGSAEREFEAANTSTIGWRAPVRVPAQNPVTASRAFDA